MTSKQLPIATHLAQTIEESQRDVTQLVVELEDNVDSKRCALMRTRRWRKLCVLGDKYDLSQDSRFDLQDNRK